jgi:DNA-binding beta-propeller fold protein YncE
MNCARTALLVSSLLCASLSAAQTGFPNAARTPGELLTAAPLGFASDGRGAIIAFHGGLLYTAPEHPSSAAGSSMQIKIWDISSEERLRNPRLVENLGQGPMNMQAHGYVLHDAMLQLGGDNWSFLRTGYQQYERRFWQPGLHNVVFERGLLVPGWNFGFHSGGVSALGNWFYRLDDLPFGIARRGNPASLVPTEQWAVFDHLALSGGVKGMPLILGDLLLIGSEEQTLSGLAIYDLKPTFRVRGTPPTLLSTFKQGATGGYWPELFGMGDRLYVFFPRRNDGARGWQVVDVSDPGAPFLVSDVTLPGEEGPMYVQFQDQHAFTGRFKLDMANPNVPLLELPVEQAGFRADTTQFALPLGNLLVTGGLGSLENQAWRIWAHQAAPDTRSPTVGYHRPRPNQTDWPREAPLAFLIHETLRAETINAATVILRPVGGAPLTTAMNFSSGQQLTMVPTQPLAAETEYEVHFVGGGVHDVAGNPMAEYRFRFSTGSNAGGNQAPQVQALSAGALPLAPGQSATFAATASDPEGGVLEYRFTFGDGNSRDWAGSATAAHVYSAAGRYPAMVQVRDAQGLIASRSLRVSVFTSPPGPRPSASSALAVESAAGIVHVAHPDGNSVGRVRLNDGTLLGEYATCADPRSVALDAQARLWIACVDDDRVEVRQASDGVLLHAIDTGYGSAPQGLIVDATRQRAYVALSGAGRVLRIDTQSLSRSEVITGPVPHALALSADGSRLLATRLISARDFGEIYDIATSTMTLTRRIPLRFRTPPFEHSANGRGVPNQLTAIAIDPSGARAYVAAKKDSITRGELFFEGQHDLNPDHTVRAELIAIDLATHREDELRTRDLDNAEGAAGLAFSPDGDYLFVSLQGHDQVLVVDTLMLGLQPGLQNIVGRHPVGAAPQALAVAGGAEPRLLTQNFLGRSLTRHLLAPLLRDGLGLGAASTQASTSIEGLSPPVLAGKRLFYNASDPRMSLEGYLSCAACHLDGGSDGRVYDFSSRGEGLRNNIDLRGRAGIGHGRVHWSANFDEIQDFENDIRAFFGGTGFMSQSDFAATQSPLGPPKAGRSLALDQLAAYVASLDLASVPRSPHRQPDGRLTAAAIRGQSHFQTLGCAACHAPQSGFRDGALHNVGTRRATSGTLPAVDTPTLLGVHANPPYLHDGSANTLAEVFPAAGGPSYPAEDASALGGATVVTQFIDINNGNSSFGHFVELDAPGERILYSGVDGGAGGGGRLAIRYQFARNSGSFSIEIRVNGQSISRTLEAQGEHLGWRELAIDPITLSPGASNTIELRALSGGFPPFSIDEIVVSGPAELALAAPHRVVMSLSPGERDDLVAWLLQLDGRDSNGALPGGGDALFASGFEEVSR